MTRHRSMLHFLDLPHKKIKDNELTIITTKFSSHPSASLAQWLEGWLEDLNVKTYVSDAVIYDLYWQVKSISIYNRSWAYYTINHRMPVIIAQIADGLCRKKDKLLTDYGQEGVEESKQIIGKLSKLRYELQTNKPIFALRSQALDAQVFLHLSVLYSKSKVFSLTSQHQ